MAGPRARVAESMYERRMRRSAFVVALFAVAACGSEPEPMRGYPDPDGGGASGPSADSGAPSVVDGGATSTEGGAPSASGRCPAFPAMPNAACTGYVAGTTLAKCGEGRIVLSTAGKTSADCLFDGEVIVMAKDITIKNSLVKGRVDAGDQMPGNNLVLEDVEIDGSGSGATYNVPSLGATGFSCTRCNIHGGGHGVSAQAKARVVDSWIHDFTAVSADDHMGAIAAHGGSGVKILHSVVECSYGGSYSGLCSSAVGMYGDFAQIDDYEFKNNLFNTKDGYGVYGGSASSKPFPHATNVRFVDNVFGKKFNPKCGFYGPVSSFESGNPGNVWSGNRWEDGSGDVPPAN